MVGPTGFEISYFIKISAEHSSACWRDESGLIRNFMGGLPFPSAPQLAVGFFTNTLLLATDTGQEEHRSIYVLK